MCYIFINQLNNDVKGEMMKSVNYILSSVVSLGMLYTSSALAQDLKPDTFSLSVAPDQYLQAKQPLNAKYISLESNLDVISAELPALTDMPVTKSALTNIYTPLDEQLKEGPKNVVLVVYGTSGYCAINIDLFTNGQNNLPQNSYTLSGSLCSGDGSVYKSVNITGEQITLELQ